MNRIIATLALLIGLGVAPLAQAADAIVLSTDASQTLYVRIYPSSSTAAHSALAAGTGNAVRRYAVTDAALVTAGLTADTTGATVSYQYDVFFGTSSASADDVLWGSGTLYWKDGVAQAGPASSATVDEQAIIDGLVEAGAVATPVAVEVVDDSRTWFADGYRARNIIEAEDTPGEVTFAIRPKINPGTTIATFNSVTLTGAATVTTSDLVLNRDKTKVHFTVPALVTAGTYTMRSQVTTVDGQTIVTTGTLKVY